RSSCVDVVCIFYAVYLCFFKVSAAYRHLHSFPTRRSSDLIMTSDYAEATLVPHIVRRLRQEAPNVVLDFLTPSDVTFADMDQGRVDLAVNRFNEMPLSFHQVTLWRDRSEEHTSELQSRFDLVCRLLLE